MEQINQINIRPSVSILSALRHLNYKTWFALAEFVDNAIDSFFKNEQELKRVEGQNFKLQVRIIVNQADKKIIITDNAGGIHQKDFQRALKTAEIPPISTGLSEFGMGMKSAACWFSDYWLVRSTAIGETIERTVIFDVNKIVNSQIENLDVHNIIIDINKHYTVVELHEIHNMPQRRTLGKIKDHLTSIYRDFFRNGILDLYFNEELLVYEEPNILKAPFYKDLDSTPILWKKELPENYPIRDGLKIVKGFVAILEEPAVYTKTGLSLFRRGRVILGSADEGFKPYEIFGQQGSFKDKRIFGELHLEGFQVSHTKDGFKNDADMQTFIELVSSFLDESPSLLKQAEGHRARKTDKEFKESAEKVVKDTVEAAKENLPKPVNEITEVKSVMESAEQILTNINKNQSSYETFEIKVNTTDWIINVELCWDENVPNWIEVGDKFSLKNEIGGQKKSNDVKNIGIRLSLRHPFSENFAGTDKSRITPLLRLAVAIGLSEVIARDSGINNASFFRNNINKLLTDALSK